MDLLGNDLRRDALGKVRLLALPSDPSGNRGMLSDPPCALLAEATPGIKLIKYSPTIKGW
jgi:hypothetical protein